MYQLSEVIIIGGGFAGNFLAYKLASRGVSVKVFEEHKTIGYPPHCSGLVSRTGLSRLGILQDIASRGIILSTHRCIRIHVYDKSKVFCLGRDSLLVIDRPALDEFLFEKAEDHGAEYHLGEKVESIEKDGYIKVGSKQQRSKIIVDAEGAAKVLISKFVSKLSEAMPALQMDVQAMSDEGSNKMIEVYFNTPDFFLMVHTYRT